MTAREKNAFLCPITGEIMTDPVSTSDGYSYERSAILKWFEKNDTSPITGAPLAQKLLTDNHALRESIDEWQRRKFNMVSSCDIEVGQFPIAKGSFKLVYKGKLKRLPGSVSLLRKPISVAVMELKDGSAVITEAKTLIKLSKHPRLLRYIGMCTERSPPCLLTEFAPFGALSEAVFKNQKSISPAHELTILQQICAGMEMLAHESVVHRDLALRNVLVFVLDPDNVAVTSVKVSDFGLSVNMGAGTHLTVNCGVRPIRWMAPEAIRRNHFSQQSDVWAFGVTAFELLSKGELPYFHICDDDRVARYVVSEGIRPARPTECRNASYDGLWNVIQQCWKTDPHDRPAFSELLVSLSQVPVPCAPREDSAPPRSHSMWVAHNATAVPGKSSSDTPGLQSPAGGAKSPPGPSMRRESGDMTVKKYLLRESGQIVTATWLFENGYTKDDCDLIENPSEKARERVHDFVDENAQTMLRLTDGLKKIDALVSSLHVGASEGEARIDRALDGVIAQLCDAVDHRRSVLKAELHEKTQLLIAQLTKQHKLLASSYETRADVQSQCTAALAGDDGNVMLCADNLGALKTAVQAPIQIEPVIVCTEIPCLFENRECIDEVCRSFIAEVGRVGLNPPKILGYVPVQPSLCGRTIA
eukprot:m.917454 g.917454  ORF g.917454 m.917454 type:complete len:644 (-) comp23738_c0_seq66:1804-3735(-)